MRRQRKNKKIKLPSFIEDIRSILLQRMANLAVIAVLALAFFMLSKAFLYRSDYFRLRVVEIRDSFLDQKTVSSITNQLMGQNRGKNVFRIDLKSIARTLQHSYPDAKEIAARIFLPDRLSVTMKLRKPVAIVRNIRSYPVDEDGIVIFLSANPALLTGLPVIEGVDMRHNIGPKGSGSGNLALALELLREMKKSKFIAEYGMVIINASDQKNLTLRLASGPEIRIGSEDFGGRLHILEKTLKDPRLVLDRINYIDLRFKDVVIGPK